MADTSTLPLIMAQDATGTAPADTTTGTTAPADTTGTAPPADTGTTGGTAAPADAAATPAPADAGTTAPADAGAAAPADSTGTAAPAATTTDTAAPAGGAAAPAADATHAAEAAPAAADATHVTTEHEASASGMPQLDPATFAPQLVWLGITFVLLLVLMWGVALPRVRRILAAREHKVSDDLDRAEQLKKEADAVLSAYNRSIAEARAKAQEATRAATAEAVAVVTERETAFGRTLKERLDQAQSNIEAAKTAALRDLKSVATDVAAATTAKLGGGEVPRERVAAAVEQAMVRRPGAPAAT